jgi:hypothetical protein
MFWNSIHSDNNKSGINEIQSNSDKIFLWENYLSENSKINQIKALKYLKYKLFYFDKNFYINSLSKDLFILDFIIFLNKDSINLNNFELLGLTKYWFSKIQVNDLTLWIEKVILWLEQFDWEHFLEKAEYIELIKYCKSIVNTIEGYKSQKINKKIQNISESANEIIN